MTSLSQPAARRRFLAMLWLSAALHAAVIGLTRLPPPLSVPLSPEMEVQLAQPAPAAPPVAALPGPRTAARPPLPALPVPQPLQPALAQVPSPVAQLAVAAPQAMPSPVQAAPSPEAPGPQVDIPQLADSRYYSAKELDVQPVALRRPEPAYPPQAEEQGVAGRVVIRLHLESDGSVSRIEVVRVTPGGVYGELFRQSTLDAVKGIGFHPARRNGQAVRAVVEIPVVFEPEQ